MSDWKRPVGDAGRSWFEKQLRGHSRVRELRQLDTQTYVIERTGNLSDVRMWLCDVYTLGIADYSSIRETDGEINAIVVLSVWNSYSEEAKRQGKGDDVGVFTPGELMSALHRDGHEFVGS